MPPPRHLVCALLSAWGVTSLWATDIRALHQQGQYTEAAEAGLSVLLREPWNHELRFLVADSLERSGEAAAAQSQFQTLVGTAMAEPAQIRLNSLLTATGKSAPPVRPIQLASSTGNQQPVDTPTRLLSPIGYSAGTPAPPRQSLLREKIKTSSRSAELETVSQLSADGSYRAAAREGKRLIERGVADDELRLIVANSLAWTGQLEEAIPAYRNVIQTSTSSANINDARAGLGNVLRWNAQDAQAVPLYQQTLAIDPLHQPSIDGIMYAERELKPKTTLTYGQSNDSSHMSRHALGISHRWRDKTLEHGFELEFAGNHDRLPATEATAREAIFRYQAFNAPLKPRFWISTQATPDTGVFGGVQLQLLPQKLSIEVDRINWGLRALNPRALLNGLSASHVGLAGKAGSDLGDFTAGLDYYDISDSNTLLTTNIRYTPPWRWAGLKTYMGAESRSLKFNSPDYWSPAEGYGSAYIGLQGDWSKESWELFFAGQMGERLHGEAGTSWSISGGGRLWLGRQVALGLRLWNMSSVRDGAPYRANAGTLSLEKLW